MGQSAIGPCCKMGGDVSNSPSALQAEDRAGGAAEVVAVTMDAAWTTENTHALGPEGFEALFKDQVQLLDKKKHSSVQKTVDGLNAGQISVPQGMCAIFSRSQEMYFLLWRSDKEKLALEILQPIMEAQEALLAGEVEVVGMYAIDEPDEGGRDAGKHGKDKNPYGDDVFGGGSTYNKEDRGGKYDGGGGAGPRGGWSIEQVFEVGPEGCERQFAGRVAELNRNQYFSVENAIDDLNRGNAPPDALDRGICVVFDSGRRCYYALYLRHKEAEAESLTRPVEYNDGGRYGGGGPQFGGDPQYGGGGGQFGGGGGQYDKYGGGGGQYDKYGGGGGQYDKYGGGGGQFGGGGGPNDQYGGGNMPGGGNYDKYGGGGGQYDKYGGGNMQGGGQYDKYGDVGQYDKYGGGPPGQYGNSDGMRYGAFP